MKIVIDNYDYLDSKGTVTFSSTENTNLIDVRFADGECDIEFCIAIDDLVSAASAFKTRKELEVTNG